MSGIIDRPTSGALRALVGRELEAAGSAGAERNDSTGGSGDTGGDGPAGTGMAAGGRSPAGSAVAARAGRFPLRPRLGTVLWFLGRFLGAAAAPVQTRERTLAEVESRVQALEAAAAALRTSEERLHFVRQEAPGLVHRFRHFAPVVFPTLAARFLTESLLRKWLGTAAPLQPVLRSLPHNPTTEMDLKLWRISRQLKAEGAQPTPEHPAVQAFLRRYGHRAVREIDVGMPRWAEEPEHILQVLRTYLNHGEEADAEAHFNQGRAAAEAAAAELVARVRKEKGRLRAAVLAFLLRRIRELMGLREYPKFYAVRGLAALRRVLMDLGADLVREGRLEQADDIFFVRLADVKRGGDLRAAAAAGRQEYQRKMGRRAVPRILTSTGEALYGAPDTGAEGLAGTPASAGVYEGPVRVVLDPKGAQLQPGEVLVAPGTDPAWTPLFLSAGALVMEVGGVMSHGSVVAREYGIPAVVGVPEATRRLRTGQRVRVDGETGRVVLLESAEGE